MEKKEKIIKLLYTNQHKCYTTAQISSLLDIPLRSVQRYLNEIKQKYPRLLIYSSNCYQINYKEYKNYILGEKNDYENRILNIIKILLFQVDKISLGDLEDCLYVSTSTLRNDLKQARRLVLKYQLDICIEKSIVSLNGSEKNKRKLIKDYIYGETSHSLIEPNSLVNLFPNYDITQIKNVIVTTLHKSHLYINDYNLCNLLLHIIIKIDRTSAGNNLNYEHNSDNIKENSSETFFKLSKEICQRISKIENVYFSDYEIYEYSLLIATSTHPDVSYKELTDFLSKKTLTAIDTIIKEIQSVYELDFNNFEFMKNLGLHLENLFLRQKNNSWIKNPLLNEIKKTYPFIHEIAIYITTTCLNIKNIPDDEISYLTLHLASQLEINNIQKSKITVCIISPEFYSLNKQILKTLRKHFNEVIYISNIYSSTQQFEKSIDLNCDMILSTVPVVSHYLDKTIHISYFLNQNEIAKIDTFIQKKIKEKSANGLYEEIRSLIDSSHFIIYDDIMNYHQILKLMTQSLYEENYVPNNFFEQCLIREELSETVFKDIAIPHPINLTAYESTIFIAINKKHFLWLNGNRIKVVFLLVIKKSDTIKFKPFFDFLAEYVNSEYTIDDIQNSIDYDDFMSKLKNMLIQIKK